MEPGTLRRGRQLETFDHALNYSRRLIDSHNNHHHHRTWTCSSLSPSTTGLLEESLISTGWSSKKPAAPTPCIRND